MRLDAHRFFGAALAWLNFERLAAASLVSAVALLGLGYSIVANMRTAAWEDTKYDSMVVANILSEHLRRNFAEAQASLKGIAAILESEVEHLSGHDPQDVSRWLFSGSNANSTINDLRVIDWNGNLLFASEATQTSWGDLQALADHTNRFGNEMLIGPPTLKGRGGYELVASVPFVSRGGLGGVITAHFSIAEVERLFEGVQIDRGDLLGLIYDTRQIVYRTSDGTRTINLDVGQTPIAASMRTSSAGHLRSTGTVDKIDRLYTYSKVMGLPLHVYFARDVATLNERFSERVRWIVIVIVLLAVIQIGLSVSLLMLARERSRLENQLRQLATTDGLTKLANRRRFDETLSSEWERAARTRTPVGLVIVDADHFKRFNDHYGHPDGDKLLAKLAGVFQSHARRSTDLAARVGGEEFVLLLPGQGPLETHRIGEAVRAAVEALRIDHAGHPRGHVTVSVGAASLVPEATITATHLLECADEALYRAKAAGRNVVMNADDFLNKAA